MPSLFPLIIRYFLVNQFMNIERILKLVQILLNANPAAAQHVHYHTSESLFDIACRSRMDSTGVLNVWKLLLKYHPLGIQTRRITGNGGEHFPLSTAISQSSVGNVKYLLEIYPEAINSNSSPGLLHLAVMNRRSPGMVEYLCSVAPQLLHKRCIKGFTPLSFICDVPKANSKYAKMRAMCDTDPSIVRDEVPVSARGRLQLPVHLLICNRTSNKTPTSNFADCLRLLVRLHPQSVDIADTDGNTPLSLVLQKNMDPYFIRLLLSRSDVVDNQRLLHDWNHESRRNLLFLSFSAHSLSLKPTIFARLRQTTPQTLRVVASYL